MPKNTCDVQLGEKESFNRHTLPQPQGAGLRYGDMCGYPAVIYLRIARKLETLVIEARCKDHRSRLPRSQLYNVTFEELTYEEVLLYEVHDS